MVYLIITAGFICGWILLDIMVLAVKATAPILFNIGLGFVGGLIAYIVAFGMNTPIETLL